MTQAGKLKRFLNGCGIILVAGFIIRLGADYYQYQEGLKHFPFYYYVLGRAATFLLPSLICVSAAKLIPSKQSDL